MKKLALLSFVFSLFMNAPAVCATARPSDFVSPYNYSVMAPYMNARQRTALNPGGTAGLQTPNTIMTQVVTENGNTPLSSYVKDSAGSWQTAARGATSNAFNPSNLNIPQAATGAPALSVGSNVRGATSANAVMGNATGLGNRTVVARSANMNVGASGVKNNNTRRVVARSTRGNDSTYNNRTVGVNAVIAAATTPNSALTMEQCLADYSSCMDDYCHRPQTAYDRCYCSSRLAQLDSEYQPVINDLIKKIAYLQSGGTAQGLDSDEMEDYWDSIFGGYNDNNALAELGDALDIDWSDAESRVRGQNAFVTGNDYCIRNLTGCFYAADNLRAIYRSSIARDCSNYESYLDRTKRAAESVVENYSE